MIKLTRSQRFIEDLESTLDWLYYRAVEEGRDVDQLEKISKMIF